MGGFSNVLTGLSLVSNLVGGVSSYNDSRRGQEASLREMQARQQADYAYASQQAALRRAEIAAETKKAEDERTQKLKRAVSRQRAIFGGSGITPSTSGSAEAVLLGLFEESDTERANRERLDQLRYTALNNELDHKSRVNILALDAAREKSRIGQITGLVNTVGKTASLLS